MHVRVFLGIISAQKVVWVNVLAYPDPVPVAEGGANMHPSDVAGKCANARPGVPLEGGYACGTSPNRFAGANECTVEHTTAAEGDACTGASTAAACKGCWMHSRVQPFRLVNEKLTYENILCLPCR